MKNSLRFIFKDGITTRTTLKRTQRAMPISYKIVKVPPKMNLIQTTMRICPNEKIIPVQSISRRATSVMRIETMFGTLQEVLKSYASVKQNKRSPKSEIGTMTGTKGAQKQVSHTVLITQAYLTGKSASLNSNILFAYFWVYLKHPIFKKQRMMAVGNYSFVRMMLVRLGLMALRLMKRVISKEKVPWMLKLFRDCASMLAREQKTPALKKEQRQILMSRDLSQSVLVQFSQ